MLCLWQGPNVIFSSHSKKRDWIQRLMLAELWFWKHAAKVGSGVFLSYSLALLEEQWRYIFENSETFRN